ncbi:hypothetical protein [Natrinema caseinilyticum]|nr:hypothetical protein [Natrinema caseinilyticum]
MRRSPDRAHPRFSIPADGALATAGARGLEHRLKNAETNRRES